MSLEAVAWAKKQKTGTTGGKALLFAIADYWNPISHCFASLETLAEDSEQSIDSAELRRYELQELGLIARERRSKLGRGRTSDLIILLMPNVDYKPGPRTIPLGPVPRKLAKARSRLRAGAKPTPHDAESALPEQRADTASVPKEPLRCADSAQVPDFEAPERQEPRKGEPRTEPTPPLPPTVTAAPESGLPEKDQAIEQITFAKFWDRYGADPWMSQHEAEQQWQLLSAVDQQKATAALEPYLADCAASGRKRRTPSNYLAARIFEGFAEPPPLAATASRRVFVAEGSPEWRAWQTDLRAQGKVGGLATECLVDGRLRRGWHFNSRWPPGWERLEAGTLELKLWIAQERNPDVELMARLEGFAMVPASWLAAARQAIETERTLGGVKTS